MRTAEKEKNCLMRQAVPSSDSAQGEVTKMEELERRGWESWLSGAEALPQRQWHEPGVLS